MMLDTIQRWLARATHWRTRRAFNQLTAAVQRNNDAVAAGTVVLDALGSKLQEDARLRARLHAFTPQRYYKDGKEPLITDDRRCGFVLHSQTNAPAFDVDYCNRPPEDHETVAADGPSCTCELTPDGQVDTAYPDCPIHTHDACQEDADLVPPCAACYPYLGRCGTCCAKIADAKRRAAQITPSDRAVEYGRYLAMAAERLLDLTGDEDEDVQTDCCRALRAAIHEFRKRVPSTMPEKSAAIGNEAALIAELMELDARASAPCLIDGHNGCPACAAKDDLDTLFDEYKYSLLRLAEEVLRQRPVVEAARAMHLPPGERCTVDCRLCDALDAAGTGGES